jgi:hypothetical protein
MRHSSARNEDAVYLLMMYFMVGKGRWIEITWPDRCQRRSTRCDSVGTAL